MLESISPAFLSFVSYFLRLFLKHERLCFVKLRRDIAKREDIGAVARLWIWGRARHGVEGIVLVSMLCLDVSLGLWWLLVLVWSLGEADRGVGHKRWLLRDLDVWLDLWDVWAWMLQGVMCLSELWLYFRFFCLWFFSYWDSHLCDRLTLSTLQILSLLRWWAWSHKFWWWLQSVPEILHFFLILMPVKRNDSFFCWNFLLLIHFATFCVASLNTFRQLTRLRRSISQLR